MIMVLPINHFKNYRSGLELFFRSNFFEFNDSGFVYKPF
jgi:hypothetical protein